MFQQVRFTHVNNTANRLRYTVAYNFKKNADGTLDVAYGVAQCSKGDVFRRASGRAIASGRLNELRTPGNTAASKVPMSGKFTVDDVEGMQQVRKLVTDHFENGRKRAMHILDGQQ